MGVFLSKKLFLLAEATVSTGTPRVVLLEGMRSLSATDSSPHAGHGYAVFYKHQLTLRHINGQPHTHTVTIMTMTIGGILPRIN